MKSKLLKDGIEIFVGSKDQCEIISVILQQLSPQHNWTLEKIFDPEISQIPFEPITFENSVVRCDLKDERLVLTLPDGYFNKEKEFLKKLGFTWTMIVDRWRWTAYYIHERATDGFRDLLKNTLKVIADKETPVQVKKPMPPPPKMESEDDEYEKRVEADKKLFGGG